MLHNPLFADDDDDHDEQQGQAVEDTTMATAGAAVDGAGTPVPIARPGN